LKRPGKPRRIVSIQRWVRAHLSPTRVKHIEGTARTAVRLARRFRVPVRKAVEAAWLHDAAREMGTAEMRKVMRATRAIRWCSGEARFPSLQHAKASAALAAVQWGVKDRSVLNAVAHHTLGRPGMSPLELLVFVADFIEPGRNHADVRAAKMALRRGLIEAARVKANSTLRYLNDRGMRVHPQLSRTSSWLEERTAAGRRIGGGRRRAKMERNPS
jgi:predicted HD superfamily hydrolase involved in NAD metabolism